MNPKLLREWRATFGPRPLPGTNDVVTAEIRYEKGGNALPYFSVTGTVYGPSPVRGERAISIGAERYWPHSFGQVRTELRAAFPELEGAMRWHLANPEGPMHYRENGLYWVEKAYGVSEWPARPGDPDPREAFSSIVVLGAVEGDVWPAMVLADEECSPAERRAEVRRIVGAWLDARHDALKLAFERDVLAFHARWGAS